MTEFLQFPENEPLQLSKQPYQVKKTQLDGEKDLASLVQHASEEGAWFYLPQTNLWYYPEQTPIRIKSETEEKTDCLINQVTIYLDSEFLSDEAIFYHIHPELILKQISDSKIVIPQLNICEPYRNDERLKTILDKEVLSSHLCFPTVQDVMAYVQLKNYLKNLQKFTAKITSPNGITTFKVNNERVIYEYQNICENIWFLLGGVGLQIEKTEKGIVIQDLTKEIFQSITEQTNKEIELCFERTRPLTIYEVKQ